MVKKIPYSARGGPPGGSHPNPFVLRSGQAGSPERLQLGRLY